MTNTDLIVLEGMGRAIHTNFKAKFNVDSLKLAIIKNEWLAESLGAKAKSLGAQQFAVVFEYQPAPPLLSTWMSDYSFIWCWNGMKCISISIIVIDYI